MKDHEWTYLQGVVTAFAVGVASYYYYENTGIPMWTEPINLFYLSIVLIGVLTVVYILLRMFIYSKEY